VEKGGDEEDQCDRRTTRPACCKKGLVEVPEEPSMDRQIPVLPKLGEVGRIPPVVVEVPIGKEEKLS